MELLYGNKGESQGNQVFADLLPHLIRVIENAGMLIIDEFGNSLHNKLAEKIIEFFMENVALRLIIPGLFEPPVRTLRATIPENESHIFR